jgi:hypothetical protein
MTGMTRKGARAAVAEMRRLRAHRGVHAALAAGDLTRSLGAELIDWTNRLPAELRGPAGQILLEAAAAGADAGDLRLIAAAAYEKWRSGQPDGDDDERRFRDRDLQLGITLGGAACLRATLTPQCAAALRAVLETLGKKAGPEDARTQGQRSHDAVQAGCGLLLRAGLVPDRAGAGTRADVLIPISQLRHMPGPAPATHSPHGVARRLLCPVVDQTWPAFSRAAQQVLIIRRVTTYGSTFAFGRRSSM